MTEVVTPQIRVVIAVDGSPQAECAFECKCNHGPSYPCKFIFSVLNKLSQPDLFSHVLGYQLTQGPHYETLVTIIQN